MMRLSVIKLMVKDTYFLVGTLLLVVGTIMVGLSGVWWWWPLLVPYPILLVLHYRRYRGIVG